MAIEAAGAILTFNLIGGGFGGITAGAGYYLGQFHVQPLTGFVAGAISVNLFLLTMIVSGCVLIFFKSSIERVLERENSPLSPFIVTTAMIVSSVLTVSIGPSILEFMGFPILSWEFTALFIIPALFLGLMMHLNPPQQPQIEGFVGGQGGVVHHVPPLLVGHEDDQVEGQ